jgi:excisionase family DNA binding protein
MSGKLTTSEVARRLEVSQPTVKLWCRQGRFPHAILEQTGRGPLWQIPVSDLNGFEKPKAGRPPTTGTGKRATSQKNAGNGPSNKKKGRKK